jgi:hypothetical protein
MRMDSNSRKITVKKSELIDKINNNKMKHKLQYNIAVNAYKLEAAKQLAKLAQKLKDGHLDLTLRLTSPVNQEDEYDKILEMFKMEIKNEVELSQGEFNEYVLDETNFAKTARLSNATYISKMDI